MQSAPLLPTPSCARLLRARSTSETHTQSRSDPGAEALGARAGLGRGRPLGGAASACAGRRRRRAISKRCWARRLARRGGSGLAQQAPTGGFPPTSAPCRGPSKPPPARDPAGARGSAKLCWVGGAALAMLRGPATLAPTPGPTLTGLAAVSPTELWPPGLSSPQLCQATATYYTQLYAQTVSSAAVPGTCLDATPHGPEGQTVRCVPAGRLPVILGPHPLPPRLPLLCRVWGRAEEHWGLICVRQVRVWGVRKQTSKTSHCHPSHLSSSSCSVVG